MEPCMKSQQTEQFPHLLQQGTQKSHPSGHPEPLAACPLLRASLDLGTAHTTLIVPVPPQAPPPTESWGGGQGLPYLRVRLGPGPRQFTHFPIYCSLQPPGLPSASLGSGRAQGQCQGSNRRWGPVCRVHRACLLHRKRGREGTRVWRVSLGWGLAAEAFPTKTPRDMPTNAPACMYSRGGAPAHPPHTEVGLRASPPRGGKGTGRLRVPPSPSLSLSPPQGLAAFKDKGPLRPQTQPGEGNSGCWSYFGIFRPKSSALTSPGRLGPGKGGGYSKPGFSPRCPALTQHMQLHARIHTSGVLGATHTHTTVRTHPGVSHTHLHSTVCSSLTPHR